MKRKTFYHLSLSLPYIALAVTGALTFLAYGVETVWEGLNGLLGIFTGTVMFFTVSAIVWGPLYTWIVIVMLFWGRDKNADEVRKAYLFLPLLLACSMGIPAFFFYMESSAMLLSWGFLYLAHLDSLTSILFKNYSFEETIVVSVGWGFMAIICIAVGYMFVGIILLIERVLKRYKLFRGEDVVPETG
ncbi:MAG TPA: hypothetical protein VHP14_13390 [Anaerolineales bacterium]|nr:hypothetical protein [Anaerolineales bacterium]